MGEERHAGGLVKAVDTNLVVRLLIQDDPDQAARAGAVFDEGVFVPLTVFLEMGWLLKSRYRFSRSQVARTLRALLDMPEVTVPDADKVRWAVDRLTVAGDLADLVHLVASSAEADAFVTFDRALARSAGETTPLPIETLKS